MTFGGGDSGTGSEVISYCMYMWMGVISVERDMLCFWLYFRFHGLGGFFFGGYSRAKDV